MVAATNATAAKIILLNPISQIIQDIRYCLITDQTITTWGYIGNPFLKIVPILLVIIVLIWGSWYFRKKSKKFAEEI